MRSRRLVGAVSLALVIGCTPAPDLAAERQALRGADSLFAVATAARGADGWADFFEASGVQFTQSYRIDGREAIRAFMAPVLGPGQPRLEWRPSEAHVAGSGDLGYTLGRWRLVGTAEGVDTLLGEGHYVTIWRKTADGWRVAVDIGTRDNDVP